MDVVIAASRGVLGWVRMTTVSVGGILMVMIVELTGNCAVGQGLASDAGCG